MRKQFVTHISFILLAGLIGSCGSQSSKSEDSDKPDVVSEETVTFTGQLNVSIGLLAAKRQILYFSLVGGQVMQAPTEVKVDEEGNFSTEVNRKNDVAMAAKKAL